MGKKLKVLKNFLEQEKIGFNKIRLLNDTFYVISDNQTLYYQILTAKQAKRQAKEYLKKNMYVIKSDFLLTYMKNVEYHFRQSMLFMQQIMHEFSSPIIDRLLTKKAKKNLIADLLDIENSIYKFLQINNNVQYPFLYGNKTYYIICVPEEHIQM